MLSNTCNALNQICNNLQLVHFYVKLRNLNYQPKKVCHKNFNFSPQFMHRVSTGTGEPYACNAGKYQPDWQKESPDSCQDCSPGHYCETSGLDAPTGQCSAGYYCVSGSQNEIPILSVRKCYFYVYGTHLVIKLLKI